MTFLNPHNKAPSHGLSDQERDERGIGFPFVVTDKRPGKPESWRFVGSQAACERAAAERGLKDRLVAVLVWSAEPVPLSTRGDRYLNPDPVTVESGELAFA